MHARNQLYSPSLPSSPTTQGPPKLRNKLTERIPLLSLSPPMEREGKNVIATLTTKHGSPKSSSNRINGRGSGMSLLRAAMLLLRRRTSSKKAIRAASASTASSIAHAEDSAAWKALVGGMRPLRLLPPPPPPLPELVLSPCESYHDVRQPLSPMSRYASAVDLQALDKSEGEAEEKVAADNGNGTEPNTIDVQAEEFIIKFYEQMRLQNVEGDRVGQGSDY